jgi:hypothetical protein
MINKFKNKKTCKILLKVQKGGSSSAPKTEKQLKFKQLKKMIKTVAKKELLTKFVESPEKGNFKNFKKKAEWSTIAHLVPKNYWYLTAAMKASKLKKKIAKYSTSSDTKNTYTLIKQYIQAPTDSVNKDNVRQKIENLLNNKKKIKLQNLLNPKSV